MSIRRLSDGCYTFSITWEGQRFRKRVSCPPQHVKAIYQSWERQIFDGLTGRRRLFETITEYETWSRVHKSPEMVELETRYLFIVKAFFKENPRLHEIKRHHLIDLAGWAKNQGIKNPTLSDTTVKKVVQTLGFILNWSLERGYIKTSPAFRLRLRSNPARVAMLSQEQVASILSESRAHQYTFFLLAITTGMRHSEILGLTWDEVNLDLGMISLAGERTKSRRARQIPIPASVVAHLKQVRSTVYDRTTPNVVNYEGRPVRSMQMAWRRIRARIGMESYRIHDLRHAYATFLRSSGRPLAEIMELLGHKDLTTTQRYAHFDGMGRESADVMDRVIAKIPGQRGGKRDAQKNPPS